ncbi:MAG: hypothetical protein QOH06_3654 [Acidobacteriota bacterium]|jgi:amino acid adenylation domain-containing protein|nr:hypothetical protein [Acidobacteriota bacterium]
MLREAEGFRLSPQQRHLWALLAVDGSSAYSCRCAVRITGRLDREAFLRALRSAVDRHEILRTTFAVLPGLKSASQVVQEGGGLRLELHDLGEGDRLDGQAEVERLYAQLAAEPFDLARGPLTRCSLLALSPVEHVLLAAMPALCADAAAMENLVQEIARGYSGAELPPVEEIVQYADLAEWQNELLESEETEAGREHWLQVDTSLASALTLPFETPSVTPRRFAPRVLDVALGRDLGERVADLAGGRREGMAAFFLACWQILIWRLTARPDLLICVASDGRRYEELKTALGLFARHLPLAAHLDAGIRFRDLVQQAEQGLRAARKKEEYFRWREAGAAGEEGAPDFCQVSFGYEEIAGPWEARGGCLSIEKLDACYDRFKLKLSCTRLRGSLRAAVAYDPDRLPRIDAARLAAQVRVLVEGALQAPDSPIGDLEWIGAVERQWLVTELNDSATCYPSLRPVHLLFEEQAQRTPDHVAVTFGNAQLTYAELDAWSNRLARRLRRLGVGPEGLVGLCLDRSLERVLAVLAVLKAGGTYVPLDPANPPARLDFLMRDSHAAVLLGHEHLLAGLAGEGATVVHLDASLPWLAEESAEGLAPAADLDQMAYMIYTSGSTGDPKGVMVSHRALANRLLWSQEAYPLSPRDRVLQVAAFGFDFSVWELLAPLIAGAGIVLARPGGHQDSRYLARLIAEQEVSVVHFVPSMLRVFLDEEEGLAACRSLRIVLSGGEALTLELRDRCFARLGADLYNQYGPTEATIDATFWRCERGRGGSVPIGLAIANLEAHVVGSRLLPLPAGVPGELLLGGIGLARGYWGRPALTAERFVPHPWSARPGERLYRTGDLARRRDDGAIEFLGRIDHQVKIRGVRVELEELDAVLRRHPVLQDAAAMVREDQAGTRRLVAYLVPREGEALPVGAIRDFIRRQLPEYMVPDLLVPLSSLPLSPSGKLDRRALPDPGSLRPEQEKVFVAPRTQVEEVMASIWADVLGCERVGVFDDFFELGGHSLLAMRLVSRMREAFAIDLLLPSLFETPHIAGLAQQVEDGLALGSGLEAPPIVPVPRDGGLPLSFAQERLWFLHALNPRSSAYNVPKAFHLLGRLDRSAFARAIAEVVRRHEILRTTFAAVDGQPWQRIGPPPASPLLAVDLIGLEVEDREAEVRRLAREEAERPFDLVRGPLFRCALLLLEEERHAVLLSLHHSLADAWSMDVLTRDVTALYSAFVTGVPSALPELPFQYGDFAHWQRQWLQGEVLAAELSYWREWIGGIAAPRLPGYLARPAMSDAWAASVSLLLPAEVRSSLRTLGGRQGATLFMVLLAAFQALLGRVTGEADVAVGTPVAGRDRPGLQDLIGCFLNLVVLRTDLAGDPAFPDLLAQVRGTVLGAFAHQEMPFSKLVEELRPARAANETPLVQVVFTLTGSPGAPRPLKEIELVPLAAGLARPKFDLLVSVAEDAEGLAVSFEYDSGLFEEGAVQRMARHFETLVTAVAAEPARRISELPLLTAHEQRQIAVWRTGERRAVEEACVHRLFERRAAADPEAAALVWGGERMSYRELNSRSNRLAHHLLSLGAGRESIVGILLERSPDLVISILAALKAGCAYLPLEPSLPEDRLAFALADSGARLLITRSALSPGSSGLHARTLCLDSDRDAIGRASGEDPDLDIAPGHLAYVIYTSGSTGAPKGVMVPHGGLANYLTWAVHAYRVGEGGGALLHSPIGFDLTITALFAPLLAGGHIVLLPEERGLEALGAALRTKEAFSLLKVTPSHLDLLRDSLDGQEEGGGARVLVVGGEALLGQSLAFWRSRWPSSRVINEYGPTETVVGCCVYEAAAGALPPGPVPIGRPVANTRLHLLDRALQPVPVGTPGELHIGGAGVARGYLGRPELTAERFLPDPFDDTGRGSRLYKTGDLVRYLPGGDLEFLGRIDQQVKVRGFRIEPGEIESMLTQQPGVREAVVAVRGDGHGERRLVAYAVAGAEAPLAAELRNLLRSKLPHYMVPSAVLLLDELPLTPNGKIDLDALPEPDWERMAADAFVAPRTATEQLLSRLFSEALGLERIGIHSSFFDLGGHSLLATQVASRVRSSLGVELPLQEIFDHPTVAELALIVTQIQAGLEDEEDLASLVADLEGLSGEALEEMLQREIDELETTGELQ